MKTKRFLVKSLAAMLAFLFVVSGMAFPTLAATESTETTGGNLGDKLVAINVAVSGKVSLMFYFTDLDSVDYFEVSLPARNGVSEKVKVNKSQLQQVNDRYLLVVSVPAAQQTETISVQPFKKATEEGASDIGGKVRSYSIREYADMVFAIAEKDPDRYYLVCQALKAMLNYGAMAQVEFNHLPTQLANDGLYKDGSNPAYGFTSSNMYNVNGLEDPQSTTNIKFVSTECSLEETIAIKIYVNYTGSGTPTLTLRDGDGNVVENEKFYEYIVPEGEKQAKNVAFDTLESGKEGRFVLINGIASTLFNDRYTIEVSDGNETATCKFSVLNYAQLALEKLEDTDTTNNDVISANLAGAMYQYYQWTSAYVAGKTDGLVISECDHARTHVELKGVPGQTCSDCGYFFGGFEVIKKENDERCNDDSTKHPVAHNIVAYWHEGNRTPIHYNASNVEQYASDGIQFNYTNGPSTLTLSDFWNPDEPDASFNRFSLSYYSSEPVKITLNYTLDGAKKSTEYYLEAGEQTFSAVLPEFLDDKSASSFDSIVVESCKGTEVSFVLYDYMIEMSELSKNTTLTIAPIEQKDSNGNVMTDNKGNIIYATPNRQQLTINLSCGGAMTYYSCAYVGLQYNMLKDAATSGLAQYDWQTNENTRLIDVQTLDIPSQYSHMLGFEGIATYPAIRVKYLIGNNDGETQTTYFECTYSTVYNAGGINVLQVDTRQIDFSANEGEFTTHSMPTLHTITYPSNLFAYDGSDYWTSGTSLQLYDTSSAATYHFRSSTKEAWCAWSSDGESGNGPTIAIYAPNIDSFEAKLVGKTDDFDTMTDYNSKENYGRLAMQKTMKTYSYEAVEFSYMLAITMFANYPPIGVLGTGARAEFAVFSGFAQNEDLNNDCVPTRIPDEDPDMTNLSFAHEQMCLLLRDANNAIVRYSPSAASAGIDVTGSESSVKLDFTLYRHLYTNTYSADNYEQLRLTYMVPAGDDAADDVKTVSCNIYLCSGTSETPIGSVTLIADGVYRNAVIDISDVTGNIDALKFEFPAATGDTVYLRSMQLLTEEKRFTGADYIAEVDVTEFLTFANTSVDADTGTPPYENGAIKLVPSDVLPSFTANYNNSNSADGLNLNLVASNYKTLKFTYMMPKDNIREAYNCEIIITTDIGEEAHIRCDGTVRDGNWHTVLVPLPDNLKGTFIKSISVKYLDYAADEKTQCTKDAFYLYSFILSPKTIGEELASVDFTKKGSAYIQKSVTKPAVGEDSDGDGVPDYDYSAFNFTYIYQFTPFIIPNPASPTSVAFDEASGSLTLTAQDSGTADFDPYVLFSFEGLNVSADNYSGIRIKYKIPEGSSTNQTTQIFIETDEMQSKFGFEGQAEAASIFDRLVVDGEYHYLEFDFSKREITVEEVTTEYWSNGNWAEDYWSGIIENVRLDYIITYYPGQANTMYITSVELIPVE